MNLKQLMDAVLGEISGKKARDLVGVLEKMHRVQGSPGYREAAEFLAYHLEELDLDRVAIEQFPCDGKAQFWSWDTPISWRWKSGEMRLLEPVEEPLIRFDEIPMGMITHSQPADVTAEVVYVGSGSKDSDFAGKDVKGKIALLDGGPRGIHAKMVDRGIIGFIAHPSTERAGKYPDMVIYDGLWPDAKTRSKTKFGFSISYAQGERLKRWLAEGKKVRVHCKVDAELYDGHLDVLLAEIKGKKYPEQSVCFVAHLCHPAPSANDNASGSAALVEIARVFNKLIKTKKIQRPDCTIRFLWVPEFHGTVAWMHRYPKLAKNTIACLNLDMVGESPEFIGEPLTVIANPASCASTLDDIIAHFTVKIADDPRGVAVGGWKHPMNFRFAPFSGGSDHILFSDSFFGVPSVMFGHPDPFHHCSLDTVEMVDATEIQRTAAIAASTALTLAYRDQDALFEVANLAFTAANCRLARLRQEALPYLLAGKSGKTSAATKLHQQRLECAAELEFRRMSSLEKFAAGDTLQVIKMFAKQLKNATKNLISEDILKSAPKDSVWEVSAALLKEAEKFVPKKIYPGIMNSPKFQKISKKDKEWLSTVSFNRLGDVGQELLNWADGTRSVLEIWLLTTISFQPYPLEEALKYLQLLKEDKIVQ